MNPEPDPVESLFAVVLGKPAEERAAFLDQACSGDAALRQRVEALLKAEADAGAGAFLTGPHQWATSAVMIAEGPGTRIGPYKLLQQIGEGGMGVVYMAEQEQPVRRRVALKIIKPGMDSAQVVARFEAERQALAMMDHQNIARVLDAGTTPSGRPYFVMELVHGVPITKFCDDHQLTPRQRLELFTPVCQAIQHAHQKGVIHRDVKPSNVLVTLYDDKPVPKVIDFGVAKAVEQRLTEKTLFTQFGTLVGTFEYMSPEQAEMNAFGVDTRSDVYSLGVLLYELLTGTTPLERERLRRAALDEVVRLIRLEEAPRPSARLSTSGNLPKIAAARKTEPSRLALLLRGELDWIVMRCLEKDRVRRYETASALARDVERYLHDEAVEACPPSAGYRLRKFARKNRVALITAAAFVALLILGAGVSAWLAVRANQAATFADEKRQAADIAQQEATDERNRANQAAADVTASAAETRRALDRMTVANGIELAEKGNLFGALPWLVRPLERGGLTPEEEKVYRTRVACYLRQTPGRPTLRQVFFPDGPLSHAAWSADGKRVLTVSNEVVQVWDVQSGECITTLRHPADVTSAQFTPDGSRVLTVTELAVWTWDARSGRQLGSPLMDWEAFLQQPLSLLPQTPLQLLGNIGTQKMADSRWFDHGGPAEISRDGRRALFAYGRRLGLLDLATRKPIQHWLRGTEWLYKDHALSPDGKWLMLIREGRVSVQEVATGKTMSRAVDHGGPVAFAAFNSDGTRAIMVGKGGIGQIWDAKTWQPLAQMSDPDCPFGSFAQFSPDSRFVVSWELLMTGAMQAPAIWEAESGRLVRAIADPDHDLQEIDWRPGNQQFLRASRRGDVTLWNASSPDIPIASFPHGNPVTAAIYGPDGCALLTATRDGEVRIWNLGQGNRPFLSKPPGRDVFSTSFQLCTFFGGGTHSHFGSGMTFSLKRVTGEEEFPLLDLGGTKEAIERLLPHGTLFHTGAFSPDHSRILTSHVDPITPSDADAKSLQLWDSKTGRRLGKPLQLKAQLNYAAFSADSRLVVAAAGDGTACLLDARTGEPVGSPLQHGAEVLSAAFSPDGELLITCGADHTARLWRTRTGQPIGEQLRHEDEVTLAAFSSNGQTLATASLDGAVRLWDDHGTPLGLLKCKGSYAVRLLFHPSGLLVVVLSDGKMRLWDVASQQEASPVMEWLKDAVGFDPGWEPFVQIASGARLNGGFDAPSDDRPVGDLVKLSQLYSGRRMGVREDTVALSKEERQTLWRELRTRYPEEFAVSSEAALAWRIGQLESGPTIGRPAQVAFHRRWLAAELAEAGWQPGERGNENLLRDDYWQRLQALALHGRHAEATDAADALAARWPKDADTVYQCACVHALAAGAVKGDAALAGHYAVRAVALLRQAADAGYKDLPTLQKDQDLNALRGRDDFKTLLKERVQTPK